jgi:hypothetical protein
MRARFEVAHVLRGAWDGITASGKFNSWQLRTLDALARCRTASLGGHVDACSSCGAVRISYNSCRNRHCPKCQTTQRDKWIAAREKDILPVKYFHVVFTLPSELNTLCMAHPKIMYDALFDASWQTVEAFSADTKHLGAQTGMFAILHTWGQNLSLHPHLHCVVPAGGFAPQGHWKDARNNGAFLFPVKAMSTVFRAKYMECIREKFKRLQLETLPRTLRDALFSKSWVVYAKRPFGGPEQVIEYLGRYTHKIAISNHRLQNVSDTHVTFSYKDYKDDGRKKSMRLDTLEFVRRFAMHILPKRFVRIRHFGILSSTAKRGKFEKVKAALRLRTKKRDTSTVRERKVHNPLLCSCCGKETIVRILDFDHRGPPLHVLAQLSEKRKAMNENTGSKKTA